MPSRAELEVRAAAVSVSAESYANDSKLEQAVLYAEKAAVTVANEYQLSGEKNV